MARGAFFPSTLLSAGRKGLSHFQFYVITSDEMEKGRGPVMQIDSLAEKVLQKGQTLVKYAH